MVNIINNITNRQMVFILFLTLSEITLIGLPKNILVSADNGFWIPLIIASIIFGLFTVLIVKLNLMFKGKVLFEYTQEIIGKKSAAIIAVFYILYFLTLSVFMCVTYSDILHYDFLFKTPRWGELLIGIPLYGYIAYKGVTNIARLFAVIGPIILTITLIFFLTMFIEGRLTQLLPLYIPSDVPKYFYSIKDTIVPFLGMEVLTIIPFTAGNRKAPRVAFLTVLGIGLFYIIATAGTIIMVGRNEVLYHNNALIEAIRLIQYPHIEFMQRVDIVYLTFGFMGIFASKSIVYFALTEYVCKLLPKIKRIITVIILGILIFIISIVIADIPDIDIIFENIISVTGIVAALLIPGILFLTGKVKKLG